MTHWCLMIRFANLLQAPTVSLYQLVKTMTFVLYLFDMVEMNKIKKLKNKNKNKKIVAANPILFLTKLLTRQ